MATWRSATMPVEAAHDFTGRADDDKYIGHQLQRLVPLPEHEVEPAWVGPPVR